MIQRLVIVFFIMIFPMIGMASSVESSHQNSVDQHKRLLVEIEKMKMDLAELNQLKHELIRYRSRRFSFRLNISSLMNYQLMYKYSFLPCHSNWK